MEEIAKAFATNYYLQAISIAVAIGTLAVFLWKALKWAREFFRNVVRAGIRTAYIRTHRKLALSAVIDSEDVILFQSTVVAKSLSIVVQFIAVFVIAAYSSVTDQYNMDKNFIGSTMPKEYYLYSEMVFRILFFVISFSILNSLARFKTYVRLVRRRRQRIKARV